MKYHQKKVSIGLITIPEHSDAYYDTELASPRGTITYTRSPRTPIDLRHTNRKTNRRNEQSRSQNHRQRPSNFSKQTDVEKQDHQFSDPRDAKIASSVPTVKKTFHVRIGKPKDLCDMLSLSARGATRCNQSGQLAYLTALAKGASQHNMTAFKRSCNSSLPLNYIPFEANHVGARESKIKIFQAPTQHEAQADTFSMGMRWQQPRSLEELGMIPRLLGTDRAIAVRNLSLTSQKVIRV